MFKLNFLVLLSNFLVESNNNGYVKTDIIGFCGDIEKCSNYNWCGFVIDKLLTTHEFWAGNPSTRHFTRSLPLLTVRQDSAFHPPFIRLKYLYIEISNCNAVFIS